MTGLPALHGAIVVAIVALHMWTELRMKHPPRYSGALTVSRIAVALGRIRLEYCMGKARPYFETRGFRMGPDRPLAFAAYADSLWVVSHAARYAIDMKSLIGRELGEARGLTIPLPRRDLMASRPSAQILDRAPHARRVLLRALGHDISDQGSPWPD